MGAFTRILIGLLVAVVGILMVYKTQWFMNAIGSIDCAERTFGGGGTRFFFKLFGILVAIFGFIVMTNLFEFLFGDFLLSLFGVGR